MDYGSSGSATTSQRITDPTTGLYYLRVTGTGGNKSISFNQRIESQNSLELVNKVVNLSFDAFASTNTTVTWIIAYPTATDNWQPDGLGTTIASGSVNVTTSKSTFNTGPISLDTNVSKGLLVRFVVLNHTAGKTIDLTNVQLERGSTATPFEYRPIQTELALCQRYFEKSYDLEDKVGTASPGWITNVSTVYKGSYFTSTAILMIPFKALKRVAPLVKTYDGAGTAGAFSSYSNTGVWTEGANDFSTNCPNATQHRLGMQTTAFGSPNRGAYAFAWTADAEL